MYLIHNRQKIIILASLRHDMLTIMHERHVKMNGIRLKLRKVWWPKLEKDMKKFKCDAGLPTNTTRVNDIYKIITRPMTGVGYRFVNFFFYYENEYSTKSVL